MYSTEYARLTAKNNNPSFPKTCLLCIAAHLMHIFFGFTIPLSLPHRPSYATASFSNPN
ncbi:hypothetical protein ACRALDRAFT_212998 [Sodiomyces alcalophilus JCM 7366]|uniref:uncharacterized protein n=1 Tax=Sodiomyces alcalophilus JCM 7366 TaxID=591952 RepID=UPI0039B4A677